MVSLSGNNKNFAYAVTAGNKATVSLLMCDLSCHDGCCNVSAVTYPHVPLSCVLSLGIMFSTNRVPYQQYSTPWWWLCRIPSVLPQASDITLKDLWKVNRSAWPHSRTPVHSSGLEVHDMSFHIITERVLLHWGLHYISQDSCSRSKWNLVNAFLGTWMFVV